MTNRPDSATLRDSEELARRIIEAVPGGVVHVAASGAILRANVEALRILGLRYEELTARYTVDFETETIWEDGSPCPAADYPVTKALLTGQSQSPVTIGIRRRDGSTAWAVFRAVPVLNSATGEVTGAVATFLEITERKRAEEALRVSEEKWRALAEGIPDFAMMLDREGRIQFINRTLAEFSAESVRGTEAVLLAAPGHRDFLREKLARVFETGATDRFELEGPGPGGRRSIYENQVGPIRQDGRVVGAILVARDLTDRVALVQQLAQSERMASVGLLAAGVAHEINNPLAYMLGNLTYVIDRWQGDPEHRRALVEAREGAMRVRDIVRDLRTFSREGAPAKEAFDVHRVIDATLQIAHHEIRHRAELVRDYGDVPEVVANEPRLGQVLLNLLVNAAQAIAIDSRSGLIVVSTRVGADGQVVIEVRDNGAGIPREDLARIFDPFFTTKPVGQGTGLGLSICYNLVAAMSGQIAVESEIGAGTTVRIQLPAALDADAGSDERRSAGRPRPEGSQRILVVDDDLFVARSLERILSPPHEVVIAISGAEALRLLDAGPFDAVFCDVMMPGTSGFEVFAKIARDLAALVDRFVFITGGVFSPEIQARVAALGRPCALKPFDDAEIFALLGVESQGFEGKSRDL